MGVINVKRSFEEDALPGLAGVIVYRKNQEIKQLKRSRQFNEKSLDQTNLRRLDSNLQKDKKAPRKSCYIYFRGHT